MRKVFIDCGYNMGEVTRDFNKKLGSEFEYFAFEANPYLYEKYKNVNQFSNLQNKAVWVENGKIPMYVVTIDRHDKENPYTGASTLIKEKSDWNMQVHKKQEIVDVECIDFSKFLIDNFSQNDEIILKLDVEGAEYAILEKMITDNSISYINEIYVEFHDEKVGLSSNDILTHLSKENIKVNLWH